jgi:hypothetical protein
VPPPQPVANPDEGPEIDIEPAALETETPEIQPTEFQSKLDPAGRDAVLAAFSRNWMSPQPATPQPRPQVQTDREPLSEAAIDELLAAYAVGNLPWPRRLLGPEPGHPHCRIPHAVLKRNRLARVKPW